MSYKNFLDELKKGLPRPVYLLHSDEDFLLEEAIDKAVEAFFASHPGDFNYNLFYPSTDIAEIIDTIKTLPFMAPRRLVVLRETHQLNAKGIRAIEDYIKNPVDTSCLLMVSAKAPKGRFEGARIIPMGIRPDELKLWIAQRLNRVGIKITEDARDYLMEMIGPDMGILFQETERLSLLGRDTIEKKDIEDSILDTIELTPFNLVDAIERHQAERVMRIFKNLMGSGQEPTSILGALCWHYKRLYSQKKQKDARRYDSAFLRVFKALHEADIALKGAGRPEVVLQSLFLKLLQKSPGH